MIGVTLHNGLLLSAQETARFSLASRAQRERMIRDHIARLRERRKGLALRPDWFETIRARFADSGAQ